MGRMYAVLFDIDGTLIQTGGAGHLAFSRAFADEFGVEKLAGDVSFAGRSDRAIALDLMRAHDVPATPATWLQFRRSYLTHLPGALAELNGVVLPGIEPLLIELGAMSHVAVGLLTGNLRAGAETKLSHYRLWGRFPFGGYGDESTDRSDIARAALAEAERHAAENNGHSGPLLETMVVGDTVHDIRCARAIGAFAVAVPTGHSSADELATASPDLILPDLSDPRPLLERIEAIAG